MDVIMPFLGIAFFIFILTTLIKMLRIVRQSTQAIVERLGRYNKSMESGIHFLIPFVDRISFIADLREQLHTFEPQPVITQDNVTVYLNAVTYYRIVDAKKAFYGVASYHEAIEQLVITTLRNLIGELELDETLTSRNVVNNKLQETLDEVTGVWGIKVTRVEVKEITPARDIIEAMSAQMVAERNRRAAILEAEGQKKSAILKAEGDKLARILEAEGIKESAVLEATGEAEAAVFRANGEKEALQRLLSAFDAQSAEERVLALKYLEMLPKLAEGKGVSMVIPDRLSNLASLSSIAGEFMQRPKDAQPIHLPRPE